MESWEYANPYQYSQCSRKIFYDYLKNNPPLSTVNVQNARFYQCNIERNTVTPLHSRE